MGFWDEMDLENPVYYAIWRACFSYLWFVYGEWIHCTRPFACVLQDLYFLPEEFYTPPVKIKEFVDIYAPFYPKFSRKQFLEYLEEFQLSDNEKSTELSLGQKKKALIGFALSTNTKILLMDEPTNGLDIPSKSQFRKIIASVAT